MIMNIVKNYFYYGVKKLHRIFTLLKKLHRVEKITLVKKNHW